MSQPHPYHHGSLAAALIAAATAEVRANGADSVSLRAIAAQVGVSPSAAYHHFPDKAALLAQVGLAGIERLEARMAAAVAMTPGSDDEAVVDRFRSVGRAYVEFALAEPNLFRHMFGPLCPTAVAREDTGAFQLLLGCLDELAARGLLRPGIRPGLELLMWSTVHGASELALQGQLSEVDLALLFDSTIRTLLTPHP